MFSFFCRPLGQSPRPRHPTHASSRLPCDKRSTRDTSSVTAGCHKMLPILRNRQFRSSSHAFLLRHMSANASDSASLRCFRSTANLPAALVFAGFSVAPILVRHLKLTGLRSRSQQMTPFGRSVARTAPPTTGGSTRPVRVLSYALLSQNPHGQLHLPCDGFPASLPLPTCILHSLFSPPLQSALIHLKFFKVQLRAICKELNFF